MRLTTRDFIKHLGFATAAGIGGVAHGDTFVSDKSSLPPGSCGDPQNPWFGKHIFPLGLRWGLTPWMENVDK